MADTEQKCALTIGQGTTSSRMTPPNRAGGVVSVGRLEHKQIFPRAGWVRRDPDEIWDNVRQTIDVALGSAEANHHEVTVVSITNRHEVTIIWDRATGKPVYNAIVWQDTHSQNLVDRFAANGGPDRFHSIVDETLSAYASITKVIWILENVPSVRERTERGELAFGNPDTWFIWNITGGAEGGVHVTDVTNASRMMLIDLRALQRREGICEIAGVPMLFLPEIRSSSGVCGYGRQTGLLPGRPITDDLGNQQAATFGRTCFQPGMAKNTYGTGYFVLMNTGTEPQLSDNGLITTICYETGDRPAAYVLEGSITVSDLLIQWLCDNLEVIATTPEVEALAASVDGNGGVYFVPTFSGLFAPH